MIADYLAPNVEPFEGTCDSCGEGEKLIVHSDPDTSAYVCADCVALEEKAIQAASEELNNVLYEPHVDNVVVARIAINAYIQAKWMAEHTDGTQAFIERNGYEPTLGERRAIAQGRFDPADRTTHSDRDEPSVDDLDDESLWPR